MIRSQTKRIALCGVMAAVSVVILLLGAVLGLGIYLAPIIAGLILMPVGRSCGVKYHVMLWLVVSALAFLLVPEVEEDLMYFLLFGWYPILYPRLGKLPRWLQLGAKLLLFNAAFLLTEFLVMWIFVPQAVELLYFAALLALGNLMFLCYDRAIPTGLFLLKKWVDPHFKGV